MDERRRKAGLGSRGYQAMCRALVEQSPWCRRCGKPIDMEITRLARIKGSEWYQHPLGGTAGHIISVRVAPHLAREPSNHQPEHRRCNSQDGQRLSVRMRRRKTLNKDMHKGRHSRDWD